MTITGAYKLTWTLREPEIELARKLGCEVTLTPSGFIVCDGLHYTRETFRELVFLRGREMAKRSMLC